MVTWGGLQVSMQPQAPWRLWPLLHILVWRCRCLRLLAIRARCSICKMYKWSREMDGIAEGGTQD